MMKKWLLLVFAFVMLLSSCLKTKEKVEAPQDLIQKEEMIEILYDIQLLEARHQRRLYDEGEELRDKTLGFYTALWGKYSISEEQFKKSYNYYMTTPQVMHGMWEEILKKLTEEQSETQKELDKEFSTQNISEDKD